MGDPFIIPGAIQSYVDLIALQAPIADLVDAPRKASNRLIQIVSCRQTQKMQQFHKVRFSAIVFPDQQMPRAKRELGIKKRLEVVNL
jgi:hypothetical protein